MTIEMNASMMRIAPNPLTIMKKNKELRINCQFLIVLNTSKNLLIKKFLSVLRNGSVMITKNQMNITIQLGKIFFSIKIFHKRNVAQMINIIIGTDHFIPSFKHFFVHFLNVGKGSARIFNYVSVPEVRIGTKKFIV